MSKVNMEKSKFSFGKIFLIVLFIIIELANIPNFKRDFGYSEYHSGLNGCSIAIYHLTDALEQYNSNQSNPIINEINNETIETLKNEGYLTDYWKQDSGGRTSVIGRKKCKYLISGDITREGFVYCEYHGSVNYREADGNHVYYNSTFNSGNKSQYDINKVKIPPSKEYYRDERNKKINDFIDTYGLHIVIGILITITIFA